MSQASFRFVSSEPSTSSAINLADYLEQRRNMVERAMRLAFGENLNSVEGAACYSLFLKSKRLRPILCLEVAKAFGCNEEGAMPAAVALEMLHTYSLIHDDLPAMDDDDLRRGQPTNHKKYGEATAILAGDGLLTKSFEVLATAENISPEIRVQWVKELALASGMQGMVLGQEIDLKMQSSSTLQELENLHLKKTGALIAAAVVMGAIAAQVDEETQGKLRDYALQMGLAFQIRDDVLDIEGGAEIGKTIKSDEKNSKSTYVSLLGLEKAKLESETWYERALKSLSNISFKNHHRLSELTEFVVRRHL